MTEETTQPVEVEEEVPEQAPPPPPPLEGPPVQESLAEQIQRERTELPDSTGPSDVVPNKPNIRPPVTEAQIAESEEVVEPEADSPMPPPERQSAADLIAAAQAAETSEELDAIEAQAEGRTTVLDAVAARRQELGV